MPPPPRTSNRLQHETSPYLLQHAHNPVDWYPWGDEALERARREDKPIFLSIGYAACHWCHVMERESFEDEDVARLMNEHFVCIKVDREERPDLDDVYMAATVAMSGSGGWPMSVFLAPDQRPFFAGTYFPKRDARGRPGFGTLLRHLAELWQSDRERVLAQAAELTSVLAEREDETAGGAVALRLVEEAIGQLARAFDPLRGGFSAAPKFPAPAALSLLMRHHHRTGDPHALQMAVVTLDAMKDGGIYDHVGGGFARYSTDEDWLVPHFEKMLYDNAQLARVYLEAYQLTGAEEYRRVAAETLDYVAREMQGPEGGYFSATDADSEGVEGKFFVFTKEEIEAILPSDEARRFCAYYDVTAAGNWEGKSVLHTPRSLFEVARELGEEPDAVRRSLDASRAIVYAARAKRVPPLCDDKVLASWNGLMIGAMAEGYRVLRDDRYLDSATRAAHFVAAKLSRPDGGLYRTARAGRAHLDAYLEDYAFLADALIDLYEAGAPEHYLREAERLAERMLADFGDPGGGAFYQTSHGHEPLVVRMREGQDGAIPNPNAVAARALARLAAHRSRPDLRSAAERAIQAYGRLMERAPRAFCTALATLEWMLEGPVELAFVGAPGEPGLSALWDAVSTRFVRDRLIAHGDEGPAGDAVHPLLAGKTRVGGEPALYVCRDFACRAPITRPDDVDAALGVAAPTTPSLAVLAPPRARGLATPEGTHRFAARMAAALGPQAFSVLGRTGLTVSRLGLSASRFTGEPAQVEAAGVALERGVNLIVATPDEMRGGGDRAIGLAIARALERGSVRRDEIVLAAKLGYARGAALGRARQRAAERGGPPPIEVDAATAHSFEPAWLEEQLTRALVALGVTSLDLCLLQDPERQLGGGSAVLERALEWLERQIGAGRIGAYGVSSEALARTSGDAAAPSLQGLVSIADASAGARPRLQVVQVPLNLREPSARLAGGILDLARDLDVAVLVQRPLTVVADGRTNRLTEPLDVEPGPAAAAAVAALAALERDYRRAIGQHLGAPAGSPVDPQTWLRYAEILGQVSAREPSATEVSELLEGVTARASAEIAALDRSLPPDLARAWASIREGYASALDAAKTAMLREAAPRGGAEARGLRERMTRAIPGAQGRALSLPQLALAAVLSEPRVASVVVGLTRTSYVDEALSVLADPPDRAEAAWSAVDDASPASHGEPPSSS